MEEFTSNLQLPPSTLRQQTESGADISLSDDFEYPAVSVSSWDSTKRRDVLSFLDNEDGEELSKVLSGEKELPSVSHRVSSSFSVDKWLEDNGIRVPPASQIHKTRAGILGSEHKGVESRVAPLNARAPPPDRPATKPATSEDDFKPGKSSLDEEFNEVLRRVNLSGKSASKPPQTEKLNHSHLTSSQELTDILKELRQSGKHKAVTVTAPKILQRDEQISESSASGIVNTNGSRAVLSALRALQDKIRKLEREKGELVTRCTELKAQVRQQESVVAATEKKWFYELEQQNQHHQDDVEKLRQEREQANIRCTQLEEQKKALLRELDLFKERHQEAESGRRTALAKLALLERKRLQSKELKSGERETDEDEDNSSGLEPPSTDILNQIKEMRKKTLQIEKLLSHTQGRGTRSAKNPKSKKASGTRKTTQSPDKPPSPSRKASKPQKQAKRESSSSAPQSRQRVQFKAVITKKPVTSRLRDVSPQRPGPKTLVRTGSTTVVGGTIPKASRW